MVSSRRRARCIALQVLYEIDLAGHDQASAVESLLSTEVLSETNRQFVRDIVSGIIKYRQELDGYITRFAPSWPLTQLSVIDRNILRLSIYELLHVDTTPVKVAINEAVELAKAFGSDNSPKFVNGVLSSVSSTILDSGNTGRKDFFK